MAGHSHSANIAIRKGAVDKKRGKLFSKLSKAIMVAARHGGSDPTANLKLRYAIDKARQNSMPRDNIERAVKKGCGELGADEYVELLYEGYGPAGVAVLADCLTDNRNRTAGEIRKVFEVNGGNLGATNCVGWMFDRKGLFLVPRQNVEEDRLLEIALDAGADDVRSEGQFFEVLCDPTRFDALSAILEEQKIPTEVAEISRIPQNTIELDLDSARLVLALTNALEEHEDIQSVTANYSMSDEVLAALNAEQG